MIRMTDYSETDWASGRPYLSAGGWQNGYRQSVYRHPLGLVEIYEQNGREMTNLRFRYAGRDYARDWDKLWGDKTVARLARELIEDVTEAFTLGEGFGREFGHD